jgi:glycosyltransferase involved in cell wall biosynthesis
MSLARLPEDGSFEAIVVDNASTDETSAILGSVDGDFRAIRNDVDRGYGAACDQAAAVTAGEHLIFLREDAVPVDGWLDLLVRALDRDPAAGAALPRAVDATGRILEHEWAAVAVRRDAYAAVGGFAGTRAAGPGGEGDAAVRSRRRGATCRRCARGGRARAARRRHALTRRAPPRAAVGCVDGRSRDGRAPGGAGRAGPARA